MRLAGGVPGTGHSVLCPGASDATRWVWDDQGEAEVPEEAASLVLSLAGRSGIRRADVVPEGMNRDEESDDLHPLGHYTFEPPPVTEPMTEPPKTATPPKKKSTSASRKRR